MAKSASKEKHIHKLKRAKFRTGNYIYFCVGADCTKKFAPALALGKRTICWICDEPFEMNDYSIRLAKPHCPKCHQPKKKLIDDPISEAAEISVPVPIPVITNPVDDLLNRLKQVSQAEDEDL